MIIFENEDTKFSIDYLWHMDKYYTVKIFAKSKGFEGNCSYCISIDELNGIKSKLSYMVKVLRGTVEINDYDSDAFIKINCNLNKRVELSGQIGGSYNDHYMRFLINADQTVLNNMILCIIDLLRYSEC